MSRSKTHALTRLTPGSVDAIALLIGSSPRWTMLLEMVRHELVSVKHLSRVCRLTPSAVSMHIRVMKAAKVIEKGMGGLYGLAPAYRPAPGQNYLDLGHVRLMIPQK